MRKEISITPDENNHVETLFRKYNSYLSILEYFANLPAMRESDTYDKKWNEAVDIGMELEKAKRAIEFKYKPAGNWEGYEFDFDKRQVIFYNDT